MVNLSPCEHTVHRRPEARGTCGPREQTDQLRGSLGRWGSCPLLALHQHERRRQIFLARCDQFDRLEKGLLFRYWPTLWKLTQCQVVAQLADSPDPTRPARRLPAT